MQKTNSSSNCCFIKSVFNFKIKFMNFIKVFFLISFSFLITNVFSQEGNYSRLPETNLKSIDGDAVDLSEKIQKKKLTVISFWATWCAPCKKELNAIHEVYDKWQKELDVQLIAVSIDNERTIGRVSSYIESTDWKYHILLDMDWTLKKALEIKNIPFTVVVDSDGNILYTHQNYAAGDEEFLYEELLKFSEKK